MVPLAGAAALAVHWRVPLCPTAAFFGVPCPACGLTRASIALSTGNIGAALQLHPAVFGVAFVVLLELVLKAYAAGSGRADLEAPGRLGKSVPNNPGHTPRELPAFLARVPHLAPYLTWYINHGRRHLMGFVGAVLLAVWLARFGGWLGGPVRVETWVSWWRRTLFA